MNEVKLPPRKIYKTPRLLLADAYTIGSDLFQSEPAKEKSVYHIVARKELYTVDPDLYPKGDNRIVFYGLGRIIERLFYDPITLEEIDETVRFLQMAKITTKGPVPFKFNKQMWITVVEKYNGRPPIKIEAFPEGSVVYPNEPMVQITSMVKGMGELAAWFESKLTQVWATCERATQDRHWLNFLIGMVLEIDPINPQYMLDASSMLTDFGDRAGMCEQESEDIPMAGLLSFMGTDTFSAAYQAWKNTDQTGPTGISVNALAHRTVQSYKHEGDAYKAIYEACENNEFASMVGDCWNYKRAVELYQLPLALRSKAENNGKIVVSRPDSGDAEEQVIWLCRLAVKNGLYTEREIVDAHGMKRLWKFGTYLKFIEGDGMTFKTMKKIMRSMMAEGFAPYGWGLFGCGGGLRNHLKRDDFSFKYALNSMSNDNIGVVKSSEVYAKSSLPGPLKVLRTVGSLLAKKTVVFETEPGENALVLYYNGLDLQNPFGPGQYENFTDAKNRLNAQWNSDFMPLNLGTGRDLFPASSAVMEARQRILEGYNAVNADKEIV